MRSTSRPCDTLLSRFSRLPGLGFLSRLFTRPHPTIVQPALRLRRTISTFASLVLPVRLSSSFTGGTISQSMQAADEETQLPTATDAPRLSQAPLFIVTLFLLCVAEFAIPGGLTPRRVKEQILAKRVDEQLDLISPTDPHAIAQGGPLPIDVIHRRGLVHRGVWLFALDSHLRLLLAWRAPAMKTCPMTWSPLGEHAVSNETYERAASRGLSEEARFIVRPRVFPVGAPFLYHAVYANATTEQRTDVQWTQTFVILPRGDALDFRTLDDREAEAEQSAGENSRYQGMSLPEVVRHAVERPNYFCMSSLSTWILRSIPLVIRVLKASEKRLFRNYLRDDWAQLVHSGAPVCCNPSEHGVALELVNVSMCGVPCAPHTIDASDASS